MAQEKKNFNEMSSVDCANPKCSKNIKANVMERKTKYPIYCYICFRGMVAKKAIRTAREIRRNPKLRSLKRTHIPLKGV